MLPLLSGLSTHRPSAMSSFTPALSPFTTALIRSLYFGPGRPGAAASGAGRSMVRAWIGPGRSTPGAGAGLAAAATAGISAGATFGSTAACGGGSGAAACFAGSAGVAVACAAAPGGAATELRVRVNGNSRLTKLSATTNSMRAAGALKVYDTALPLLVCISTRSGFWSAPKPATETTRDASPPSWKSACLPFIALSASSTPFTAGMMIGTSGS